MEISERFVSDLGKGVTYGDADGPNAFVPEFGFVVPTFVDPRIDLIPENSRNRFKRVNYHVPFKYRGFFTGTDWPEDFRKEIKRLKKQGMEALILDLRNNPGGLLDAAVEVTSEFLQKGKLVVSTRGRKEKQDMKLFSTNSHSDLDMPMVVLINDGSASGSEIVAASLQDYRRAIILGTKSFGKGSVQTVIPLGDGSAVRLTTSKYFSPNGRVIHDKGISPNILVKQNKIEAIASDEKDDKPAKEIFDKIDGVKHEKELKDKLLDKFKADNQLMHAVDVLKAIKVYQGQEIIKNQKVG